MKLIREKRWPIFELRFHCFVWWGGLAKTTNTKITNLLKIKIEALDRHNSYLYYLPRLLTLVKYQKKVGLQKFAATSMNRGTYQFELVKKIHLVPSSDEPFCPAFQSLLCS
jgi:hypothetical protein